jgi:uncharacterized protein YaeQ
MKLTQRPHQPVESIAKTSSPKIDFLKWCRQKWDFIYQGIVTSQEPQVWQRRDRNGNLNWYAYDPITQRSLHGATEDEVRLWLDQLADWNDGGRQ